MPGWQSAQGAADDAAQEGARADDHPPITTRPPAAPIGRNAGAGGGLLPVLPSLLGCVSPSYPAQLAGHPLALVQEIQAWEMAERPSSCWGHGCCAAGAGGLGTALLEPPGLPLQGSTHVQLLQGPWDCACSGVLLAQSKGRCWRGRQALVNYTRFVTKPSSSSAGKSVFTWRATTKHIPE